MTAFEIAVPLIALAVAGVGTLLLRREGRKLDRKLSDRQHPAE